MKINDIPFIERARNRHSLRGGVSAFANASSNASSSLGEASGGFSVEAGAIGNRTSVRGSGFTNVLVLNSSSRVSSRSTARATARSEDRRTVVRSIDRDIARSITRI